MRRQDKVTNFIANFIPFAGTIVAVWYFWNDWVGLADLVCFALLSLLCTGCGIALGFHRYFTHRSFKTYRPLRWTLAILGSMAVEGDVITWVADHRKHHSFSDHEGDPHSPHGHGEGVRGALKGLYHAHMGWIVRSYGVAGRRRYAADLLQEPFLCWTKNFYPLIVIFSFALPYGLGWLVGGSAHAALEMLIWGGFVRVFWGHHSTWAVNSLGHFWGSRRYQTDDESRNVALIAPLTFGDGWHHNHHAFPTHAFHGISRGEALADPAGWVIRLGEKLGLFWDVVRIPPEQIAAKLLPR